MLRELEAWVAASIKRMGQLDIALIRPALWGSMVLLSDAPELLGCPESAASSKTHGFPIQNKDRLRH